MTKPHTPALTTPALALFAVLCTAFAGGRQAIALCAWLAPLPWLLWARRAEGWRGRVGVLGAALAATSLQLSSIVSAPMPWFIAVAYGVPIGLMLWAQVMLADGLRRRTSEGAGIVAFAALGALFDWGGAMLTPLGTWATRSAGVPDDLALLQFASLFGVAGIGFLMGWVPAWLAAVLANPGRRFGGQGLVLALTLFAVYGFGAWRLATPSDAPTVTVAAVTTDLGFGPQGLPSREALAAEVDALFERSEHAVSRGARLVVWNEGATAVRRDEENALIARGRAFAASHEVDLVLAYIVITAEAPLAFDNLALFIDHEGELRARYQKRHPVPGETDPSTNPVPRIERPYGVVSLAICYDADFPEMALGHASVGAEIVALPSSDWAGIDPIHTLMSRVRAIEGGYSMVRATRWAPSAGFGPRGRIRGWMDAGEDDENVLLTDLPVDRRSTLRARIGDWPMVAVALFLLLLGVRAFRRGPLS